MRQLLLGQHQLLVAGLQVHIEVTGCVELAVTSGTQPIAAAVLLLTEQDQPLHQHLSSCCTRLLLDTCSNTQQQSRVGREPYTMGRMKSFNCNHSHDGLNQTA